jgi:hypothetical protein
MKLAKQRINKDNVESNQVHCAFLFPGLFTLLESLFSHGHARGLALTWSGFRNNKKLTRDKHLLRAGETGIEGAGVASIDEYPESVGLTCGDVYSLQDAGLAFRDAPFIEYYSSISSAFGMYIDAAGSLIILSRNVSPIGII